MALHDRDYYRSGTRGGFGLQAHSAVATILILTITAWFFQLLFRGQDALGPVTKFLAASFDGIFGGFPQPWKLITANFAHDTRGIGHLAINMLFLFFFGRELEELYGKRDFWIFYLAAGSVAVLAEVVALKAAGQGGMPVLGASGAVAGVVVLYTLFYPKRTVLFMFFIPMPVWVLCVLFLTMDILGVISPTQSGVAHFAHLAGAGFGFLYRYFDLRWVNVRAKLPALRFRWDSSRRRMPERRQRRDTVLAQQSRERRPDAVSKRIDELLAKISAEGMGSLSQEERDFLVENSRRYRSS
jgi:membrane associated rhomboid family serine protease